MSAQLDELKSAEIEALFSKVRAMLSTMSYHSFLEDTSAVLGGKVPKSAKHAAEVVVSDEGASDKKASYVAKVVMTQVGSCDCASLMIVPAGHLCMAQMLLPDQSAAESGHHSDDD